jgi:hypothetical protein
MAEHDLVDTAKNDAVKLEHAMDVLDRRFRAEVLMDPLTHAAREILRTGAAHLRREARDGSEGKPRGAHPHGVLYDEIAQMDDGPPITVTRDQQEDLDPVLGQAFIAGGRNLGNLVMAAYKIGRRHGWEDR